MSEVSEKATTPKVMKKKRLSKKRRNKDMKPKKLFKDPKIASVSYMSAYKADADVQSMFKSQKEYKEWCALVDTLSANGPDLRKATQSVNMSGLFSDSAIETNKIIVPVNTESFLGIATAVLAHAYNHGFRQQMMSDGKDAYPYYAAVFIYNCLVSVAQGNQNEVPIIQFPNFLLEICAAIAPKSGTQCGAGTLGYSWSVTGSSSVPGDNYFYPSTGTQSGKFNFFVATQLQESGYNVMSTSSPTYTAQLGSLAFGALITFMNKRLVGPTDKYHPYKLQDFKIANTRMRREVSAFAATSLVAGGGVIGGYWATLSSLETTVKHRKFACFSEDRQLDRGFRQHAQTSGDTNWLVGSLLLQQSELELKNPNYPIFVPVDFYEFVDCMALFVTRLFTLYYHNNNNITTNVPNLGISLASFIIIMRKICMRNFCATQPFVQSMRFYPSSLGSTDDFIPLLVNSCGSSSALNATLKLPLFAVENLAALRARAVYPTVNPKTKKQLNIYPRYYVPVLGIYTKSVVNPDRYKYTDASGNLQPVFLSSSDFFDPVDCQMNQKYIDADCSPKITLDMDAWNKIIELMSAYVQQPQVYTGDPGVIPLTVVGDCRIVLERRVDQEEQKCDKKDKEKKLSHSKKQRKHVGIITYDKVYVGTTSQQIPLTDLSPIKKAFIMPEVRVFKSNTGVGSISSSYWRSYSAELWYEFEGQRYSASDDGDFTDMEAIREQWVSHCVKSMTADDDTVIKSLLKLTERGKAGLLGTFVGAFGGELLNTTARTLGSFIPL